LVQSLYRLRIIIYLEYRWFDGQSGGETPGLIPNPAVKPTCVILDYGVRTHGKITLSRGLEPLD